MLSVLPVILYLHSFCEGKIVQNWSDPAPTWMNIFSSSDQLVNRLVTSPLAMLPDSRKPQQEQSHPRPTAGVCPDHTDSLHIWGHFYMLLHTPSLLAFCSLGFPQQPRLKPGFEHANFCHYWESQTSTRTRHTWMKAEAPAHQAVAHGCLLLWVAKGQRTTANSAACTG